MKKTPNITIDVMHVSVKGVGGYRLWVYLVEPGLWQSNFKDQRNKRLKSLILLLKINKLLI